MHLQRGDIDEGVLEALGCLLTRSAPYLTHLTLEDRRAAARLLDPPRSAVTARATRHAKQLPLHGEGSPGALRTAALSPEASATAQREEGSQCLKIEAIPPPLTAGEEQRILTWLASRPSSSRLAGRTAASEDFAAASASAEAASPHPAAMPASPLPASGVAASATSAAENETLTPPEDALANTAADRAGRHRLLNPEPAVQTPHRTADPAAASPAGAARAHCMSAVSAAPAARASCFACGELQAPACTAAALTRQ
ncbi:uncharacterized protein LOC34620053 [Cyclospora cayetanensis]|uniref:Uncharacterized protein LOC34620053 n=1 Tax=Cyclospora cayetanensis TaxID=88456 RepID=A0A6P6RU84_9EIME|nr:uncharacterized protein LOC34620053 [Cyclospora cayetanensis]